MCAYYPSVNWIYCDVICISLWILFRREKGEERWTHAIVLLVCMEVKRKTNGGCKRENDDEAWPDLRTITFHWLDRKITAVLGVITRCSRQFMLSSWRICGSPGTAGQWMSNVVVCNDRWNPNVYPHYSDIYMILRLRKKKNLLRFTYNSLNIVLFTVY